MKLKKFAVVRDKKHKKTFVQQIYRFFGECIAGILIYFPITANQITFLSLLSVMFAAYFFGINKPIYAILYLYFAEVLDYADGIIARAKKQVTKLQCGLLCRIYHIAIPGFIFIGLGYMTGFIEIGYATTVAYLFTSFLLMMRQVVLYKNRYRRYTNRPSEVGIKNKSQKFILKIATFPMVYIKEILLIAAILGVFDLDIFPKLLFFYGYFIIARTMLFFVQSYFTMKRLENKRWWMKK